MGLIQLFFNRKKTVAKSNSGLNLKDSTKCTAMGNIYGEKRVQTIVREEGEK